MNLFGNKVLLRAVEREDLEFLRKLINDPEIEYMVTGYAFPVSKAAQEKWYEKSLDKQEPLRWMIETEKDGTVGMIVLGDFDWKNRVSHLIGIKIAEEKVTEGGVALDALNTVLKYGFEELNLNRIESSYVEYNKPSMAMNRLAGFKDEGRLRQAVYKRGEYHDLILIGILKEDYLARKEGRRASER